MNEEKKRPSDVSRIDREKVQGSGKGSQEILNLATANLSNQEIASLRKKALQEKLRLEVDAQERAIKYQDGRKLAEDHVDTFNMLNKDGKLNSQKVVTNIETGAGNMRLESKSGPTCFVATAAYGNANHQDVIFLRKFRDQILTKHTLGRLFIATYWKIGPYLAIAVNKNKLLRSFTRAIISKMILFLKKIHN